MSEGVDLWYVKLPNGDVHRVTLDQLDGAFQAGHVDEHTMVLPSDASEGTSWSSLGQLLGLDGAAAEPEKAPATPPATQAAQPPAEPEPQYVPQAAAPQPQYVPQAAAPQPQYVPQAAAPQPQYVPQAAAPQPQYVPQAAAPQPQYVPQAAAPQPQYVPQAAAQPRVYASVAPAPLASMTPPPVTYAQPMGNSLRPMSFDLGKDDLDDMPFQRKSRKGWVAAALGVAIAAGVAGFVSTRSRSSGDDISTVAAAAAMAAPQSFAAAPLPATPDPVPAPVPSPAAAPAQAGPVEASPLNPQFTTRFNEAQTEKLLAADKAHASKAKARHVGRGAHASRSAVFTHGGNKYDPLNSDL